ncbi:MAG: 50S ribosomal protein L27 [Candidatus Niyogibacteria bacterium]|nr:50S ribosomal protein L27 [Candidatus Niyogibacteria bacterium]
MAHTKSGGSVKNTTDSQPKYLGIKIGDGDKAKVGQIIVRQRGSRILAGKNVFFGKDYTVHAAVDGTVKFREVRKTSFDRKKKIAKIVDVIR